MQFTASKLALIFALISVTKADLIAFSGDVCDGSAGANVPCNGACISFTGRHSFRVLPAGSRCVTFYQNTGCTVPVGTAINGGNAACTNVNTGTRVGSLRCSPNTFCQSSARLGSGNATTTAVEPTESTELGAALASPTSLA